MKAHTPKKADIKKEAQKRKEINTEENIQKALKKVKQEKNKENIWEKYKDDFENL